MSRARRERPPSLRRTLLVWLLLPLVALVPLVAGLIYWLALGPALDGLDRALTDTAVALAQIVEVRDGRVTLPLSAQTERALRADPVDEIFFAVGDERGHLLAGQASLLALAPALPPGQWRFFEASLAGKPVRVAAHAMDCAGASARPCPILAAETLGKRAAAERAALLAALAGAAALALPMVVLAMLAVDRGMRPLRRAATDVEGLTPDRLEPLALTKVPREVRTFVRALNDLFARLREAAAVQRAFVADAAHQLRTPLAVLRVETARALQAPHPPEMHPALQRLHAAAERGSRLALQLLTLARTEGASLDAARRVEPVDLSHVASRAANRWLQDSLQAGQDLGFELAPAPVEGDPLLLAELLGNLIHNAIEHAGRGARITVSTGVRDGAAELIVSDDGPGIPPDELPVVWQRFRRGRDATGTGSGLGLTIVQDIARLHRAVAVLESGPQRRGLAVRVRFPVAQAAA